MLFPAIRKIIPERIQNYLISEQTFQNSTKFVTNLLQVSLYYQLEIMKLNKNNFSFDFYQCFNHLQKIKKFSLILDKYHLNQQLVLGK